MVHVYNWTDYIGETTLDDFHKATGIKVVYDTYDSAESVEAKLLAGKTGYDVILHCRHQLCSASSRPASSRSSTSRSCPIGRTSIPGS